MPDRYLGSHFGRYRAARLLGTGSFSWVYEAVDTEAGASVALKVLRPEYVGQESAERRFREEAETAGRLRHPNIVAITDVGIEHGAPYVAMHLYPLTLARRLELVHRLPEREVVRLGLDVAAALAFAHAHGVVHRDIKPDNILLGDSGQAVVGDFGLARAIEGDLTPGANRQVMGTPHYFSPEQARGDATDGRSDLYALGVTLFRAATGRVPFEGSDWYEVAQRHLEEQPPSPRSIVGELSPEFDQLVLRLLAKTPAERFASATLVIDALAQLPSAPPGRDPTAANATAEATLIAPAPLSAAVRKRRRKLGGRAAIAVTLLAIAGAGYWSLNSGTTLFARSTSPDTLDATGSSFPFPDTGARSDTLFGNTPAFGINDRAQGATIPTGQLDSAAPSRPSETRRPRMDIVTDGEATVYIDNREVGVGSGNHELRPASLVRVRAAFPNASPECRSALRDTSFTPRAGQRYTLTLDVRPCGNIAFNVIPKTATITLTSVQDGARIVIPADTGVAILLPAGRYELAATAPGYYDYSNDFVTIPRSGSAPTKRIPMQRM